MDRFLDYIIPFGSLSLPPMFLAWAWLSSIKGRDKSLSQWRRSLTIFGLVLVSASTCLAAFSFAYWRTHFDFNQGLPHATIVTMESGSCLATLALIVSLFSKRWTRAALLLSSLSLLWVFLLIAI